MFARGETIPNALIVDLRGKRIGEKIRVSEIHLNEGLLLRNKRGDDFSVAKIMGSKKLISDTGEETPAAAKAVAGAGAKAASPAKAAPAAAAPAAAKKK